MLGRVADAQGRFDAAIAVLDDDDVRRPSRLPGWTVGHVLTHVARNADSHRRRAVGAAQGLVVEQYAGGYAGRAAEIEAGSARPAAELIADVGSSAEDLRVSWQDLPSEVWSRTTIDVGGTERRLDELVSRRWQELEIHLVDLDIGVTHRDWPDQFVAFWLPRVRPTVAGRLPSGAAAPEPGRIDERDELAWIYCRLRRTDLPDLASWG
jgi:maleylpyruvate isomerase